MSKVTWTNRRTPQEIDQLVEWFFTKLQIPTTWVYLGRAKITNSEGELLSEGCVFDDKLKSDMQYKVTFIVAPERGAICEKKFLNRGEVKYSCVVSNKTYDDLNEFILKQYSNE